MTVINELEIRRLLLSGTTGEELSHGIVKLLQEPSLSWEEKRPFWFFLFFSGRHLSLAQALKNSLEGKDRIPFDALIALLSKSGLPPKPVVFEALFKGLKKQNAGDDLFAARGWDKWDARFGELRSQLVESKVTEKHKFKESYREKFWFLRNQRMTEQAGRVLRQMLELFPDEVEFQNLKVEFDEQWARDVLSNHVSRLNTDGFDKTRTQPGAADEQMLKCFLLEGEKISLENRGFALDLTIAFWFLEDHTRALEILNWAPAGVSADWIKAELLIEARRFIEALEHLNYLEIKYIDDPETTFSVSYLRSQCLHNLGQHASALEIMQSIVRVRPHYRSAHALIMEWSEGIN